MRLLTAFYLLAVIFWSRAVPALEISWTNNLLTVSDGRLPGGKLEVWYLEAFCRSGAWGRDWRNTTLPHRTTLTSADPQHHHLKFLTTVEPGIDVLHEVDAAKDELDLHFQLTNKGHQRVDLQWFEPACIRVAAFTGREQSNYIGRSFIFTERGLTPLDQLRRTTNALYLGGQVYLPSNVDARDANPRPICIDHPINGLIGCLSGDSRWILATASDRTHELFEGVYVCLHSDPRVDGLEPGETKHLRSKIYFVPNDPSALLKRYKKDFPDWQKVW